MKSLGKTEALRARKNTAGQTFLVEKQQLMQWK
jgi:hypothetical protein